MEQWEREEERIIKREHELRQNAKPLSQEQQQKNIRNNWMEVTDENGNKHYEPLFDNSFFIDASNMNVEDNSVPKFIIVLIVVVFVSITATLLFMFM